MVGTFTTQFFQHFSVAKAAAPHGAAFPLPPEAEGLQETSNTIGLAPSPRTLQPWALLCLHPEPSSFWPRHAIPEGPTGLGEKWRGCARVLSTQNMTERAWPLQLGRAGCLESQEQLRGGDCFGAVPSWASAQSQMQARAVGQSQHGCPKQGRGTTSPELWALTDELWGSANTSEALPLPAVCSVSLPGATMLLARAGGQLPGLQLPLPASLHKPLLATCQGAGRTVKAGC